MVVVMCVVGGSVFGMCSVVWLSVVCSVVLLSCMLVLCVVILCRKWVRCSVFML